jgi:hypothetical protein
MQRRNPATMAGAPEMLVVCQAFIFVHSNSPGKLLLLQNLLVCEYDWLLLWAHSASQVVELRDV